MRAGVTDRVPGAELATDLQEVALPVWQKNDFAHYVVQPPHPGGLEEIVGPHMKKGQAMPAAPVGKNQGPDRIPVQSHLVYFAKARSAIGAGNFALARSTLQEASTLYDMSRYGAESGYLLPYWAFAAAKAGDAASVEAYLSDFSVEQRGFDYYLARAVIAGISGKTDESARLLQSGLHRYPTGDNGALDVDYEYAEICTWLFESTAKDQFRQMALSWAQKIQKSEPDASWAWSLEAVLSDDPVRRTRAIGIASYLDPQSNWLARIPAEERTHAVRQLQGQNPFLQSRTPAGRSI